MRVRAKAISLSTASNWLFNFALAWAVPPTLSSIAYRTYFIFGSFNLAAFIHIFFMFPETAGRTLEEIEDVFARGYTFTAWRVDRNVGRKTLEQVVELRDIFVCATFPPRRPVCKFSLSTGVWKRGESYQECVLLVARQPCQWAVTSRRRITRAVPPELQLET